MTETERSIINTENSNTQAEREPISPKEIIRQKLFNLYEGGDAGWLEEVNDFFSESELREVFYDNADVFFDELVQIVENNRESDPVRVENFLNTIHESFFTASPSISNSLSVADMLIFSAKVNRVEEMRGFVGQNIIGEFVYEINFAHGTISEDLIDEIESLPNGLREEVINQLETCFSDAVANDGWAGRGVERIKVIVNHFAKSLVPLTRIVSEVAQDRLSKEEENPSLGVLTYANNKGAGKLSSLTHVMAVEDKINSDLPLGYRAVIAAKDAIIGLDHAGMARYGSLDQKAVEINNQPDAGINTLKKIKSVEAVDFREINLVSFINTLGKFWETFESDKEPADFYAKILNLQKEEVVNIFNNGFDITPFFKKDWEGIMGRLMIMVEAKLKDLVSIKNIKFNSFNQLAQGNVINPFDILNKEDAVLLTQCLRPEVRSRLEDELSISFSEISFRAEMSLLRFLSAENDEIYNKLCDVLKKYPKQKVLIAETFVDCAKDTELGEKIILLCEKLEVSAIESIFGKYLEIVAQLNNVETILADGYGKKEDTSGILKIKEALLKKGKDLLAHFANLIEEGGDTSEKALTEQLEDIQAEAVTFFLTFKTLKETGELPPIEEIRGLALEQIAGGEISESDLVAMRSIYEKNYANMPEIVEKVLSNFDKRALDPKTYFYILKHNDEVIGFAGFTDRQDGVHAHSINIDPSLKSMSLGSVLLEKTIEQEAKGNVIMAECFTFLPIGAKYIEDGFTGVGLDKYGEYPVIKIVRDDSKVFETKQKAKEDFVKEYLQFEINGGEGECDKGEYLIVKAPTQKEIDMSYLDRGHILTRYFSHTTNKGGEKKEWYAVFEKKQAVKEKSMAA